MLIVSLTGLNTGLTGLKRIYQSRGKTTRLIEGVFHKGGEIGPHTHPKGEDCAIVLSGQLGYWISNKQQITIQQDEVVFGWQNVIHGYSNFDEEPLHVLVLATPESTGLEYPDDADSRVIHLPQEERVMTKASKRSFSSDYSHFSFVTVSPDYREENAENRLIVFVDSFYKLLYVFDQEPVEMKAFSLSGKSLLRYEARS